MKNYLLTFIGGCATGLALCTYGVYSSGPDMLIAVGTKWQAAQRTYMVYSAPVMAEEEERVAEAPKMLKPRGRR